MFPPTKRRPLGASCCWSRSRWSAPRTFAMAANRIIDREIDARNPRTARRELVTGAVSRAAPRRPAPAIALLVFLGAAALLNRLCLALAPVAVIPLVVYPYGKRFTELPARDPRHWPRRSARSARGWRSPATGRWDAVRARPGGRHLDRRLRPDLRLPGRRDRPADRRELGPRPVRHRRRPVRRSRLPTSSPSACSSGSACSPTRAGFLVGGSRWSRRVRLRALDRQARRPVKAQPGVLHHERVRRHLAVPASPWLDLVVRGLRIG